MTRLHWIFANVSAMLGQVSAVIYSVIKFRGIENFRVNIISILIKRVILKNKTKVNYNK